MRTGPRQDRARVALAKQAAADEQKSPLAARPSHYPGKAKAVIHLFMAGAPSQLDLFDYKPKLKELEGKSSRRA